MLSVIYACTDAVQQGVCMTQTWLYCKGVTLYGAVSVHSATFALYLALSTDLLKKTWPFCCQSVRCVHSLVPNVPFCARHIVNRELKRT